jgi:hypothetical protein
MMPRQTRIAGRILIAAACIAAIGAQAQSSADSPELRQATELERPLLVLEPVESLNLGVIPVRSTSTRHVRVTNTSGRPVSLEVGQTSCSSILTELDDALLEPGASTVLSIEVSPLAPSTGTHRHAVIVRCTTTDDGEPRSSQVAVAVTYTLNVGYRIEPPSGIEYRHAVCVPLRRVVSLVNFQGHRGRNWRPTGVSFNGVDGWRLVSIEKSEPWRHGDVWHITIEGVWDAPDAHFGWLVIETDDENNPVHSLTLVGRIEPAARLRPSARILRVGESVAIKAHARSPWTLQSLSLEHAPEGLEVLRHAGDISIKALKAGAYTLPVSVHLLNAHGDDHRTEECEARIFVMDAD